MLPLTIRVLEQYTSRPIPGATIALNSQPLAQTTETGEATIKIPARVETAIDITAPAYVGFGISASVNSHEVWTFYLEHR